MADSIFGVWPVQCIMIFVCMLTPQLDDVDLCKHMRITLVTPAHTRWYYISYLQMTNANDPLLKLLASALCPWNIVFPWYLNEATNARVIICFSFLMQNKIQISVQINSTLIPCFQSCFQSHPETVRALTAGCSVIRDVWTYPGSATLSGLIIRQMERPWY